MDHNKIYHEIFFKELKMRLQFSIYLVIILTFMNCTSYDLYIVSKFDNKDKSNVLANKGIELYKSELEKKSNYESIPEIRKIFIMALRLYQDNYNAILYLKRTNVFKKEKFKKIYATAVKYKNRKKKSEQDEFNMCYFLQEALKIDPKHIKAIELKNEIWPVYKKLVNIYLDRGKTIKKELKKAKNDAENNTLFTKALNFFGRALLLDPDNKAAKDEKQYFENLVIDNMKDIMAEAEADIKKSDFKNAQIKVKTLKNYNKLIDQKLLTETKNIEHDIYLNQAKNYLTDNEYTLARKKIKQALDIKKEKQALDLKKNIDAIIISKINRTTKQKSLQNSIVKIDKLIDDNELKIAEDRIQSLIQTTSEEKYINQLKTRLSKIQNTKNKILIDIYKQAVDDYNNENFKEAIAKFRQIIELDENYENSQEYLDKAIEKQKALEAF